MRYTVDFETNNNPENCHVWLWAICNIETEEIQTGSNIESFCNEIFIKKGSIFYFHNLKFDGEFVVSYLLNKGFTHTEQRRLNNNQFKTLISDMGIWYSITVCKDKNTYTFYDSLKILPFKVSEIAEMFGMEISKGEIDYNLDRPKGYIATDEEIDYIKRDVLIPARALKHVFESGDTKMTAGSNALAHYKKITNKKIFEYWFPELTESVDSFIRESYKGGWVYVNPVYKNKEVGKGIILDVNSLYPSRMRYKQMPYGEPVWFNGKYKNDKNYSLYVQKLKCSFDIKKNKLPTIQIKKNNMFHQSEYLRTSNGEVVELTLTSVDEKLFFEHYNVKQLEYMGGYKFKQVTGMFDSYVDYWMLQKEEATNTGNKPQRTLAKLKQNSLYGKFAKRPKGRSKIPYLDEEGILKFRVTEEEEQGSLYIPVGTFITAYARDYTIRSAQKNYKRFLYSDTDSLHLLGEELPQEIEVHKSKLGAWKHEGTFTRAKYLGPKCYIEEVETDEKTINAYLEKYPEREGHVSKERGTLLQITCAGLPDSAKTGVIFENFAYDLEVRGKLMPRHVKGGIVLQETTFKIKPR